MFPPICLPDPWQVQSAHWSPLQTLWSFEHQGLWPKPEDPRLISCSLSSRQVLPMHSGPHCPGPKPSLLGTLISLTPHDFCCTWEPPDSTMHMSVTGSPAWEELGQSHQISGASQVGVVVTNPPANARGVREAEAGWIPGLGRSPGGGQGNPFQYSCLKNPMDRGAWQAT